MIHQYFSILPPEIHLLKPTESIFNALSSSSISKSDKDSSSNSSIFKPQYV